MKVQSLKMFKNDQRYVLQTIWIFLQIDRADYGASWTLSFDHYL